MPTNELTHAQVCERLWQKEKEKKKRRTQNGNVKEKQQLQLEDIKRRCIFCSSLFNISKHVDGDTEVNNKENCLTKLIEFGAEGRQCTVHHSCFYYFCFCSLRSLVSIHNESLYTRPLCHSNGAHTLLSPFFSIHIFFLYILANIIRRYRCNVLANLLYWFRILFTRIYTWAVIHVTPASEQQQAIYHIETERHRQQYKARNAINPSEHLSLRLLILFSRLNIRTLVYSQLFYTLFILSSFLFDSQSLSHSQFLSLTLSL